ncbi:MAG: hypothetical protein ABIB47_06390, partial [Candidatus Woesearchaeota archaeon]
MGKPITRLNPRVESSVQKILFIQATNLVLSIVMMLPKQDLLNRGPKPYDYRKIIGLCILRIL